MLETIIVVGVVGAAAVAAGRSLYKTINGKNDGCNCTGNCLDCASKGFEEMDQKRDARK